MREVKMNRVPFNPDGNSQPSNNNGRVPFNPAPKLREGDTNIVVPKYTTPKDLEIEKTLNFIQENSRRNMRDDEKDILKNMMKNPLTSKEELSDAIVTLQGKKAKQIDNSWTTPDYYMKRDEKSGNYKPVALEQGEKIPAGHRAASIWGTQESSNNDNALTDIVKSVVNGAIKLGGGLVDVAQTGYELATGSESEILRSGQNSFQALEFNKDKALSENPLYKTEGIEKLSDIFDANRVDLSPKALWGTFNTLTESLTEFGLGTMTGANAIKGAKALKYGYKGLDTALDLGKNAQKAAIFTGSYITQLGDNLDRADEAGLTGRDRSAVASLITMPMAALDAFWGLDGKIMSSLFKKSKNDILKNVIKSVERDEAGNITKNGFKELAKQTSIQYGELAKNGAKEIVTDALSEGGQEAAQEFSQKAGEQLWDKMSSEDKAKYGTDAFSAKSFGDYINSFATGWVSGIPMAVGTKVLRNKHDEQSVNAYERVKEGPEAVNALKTDLNNALEKGEITQSEHDQAIFKIDSYDKYHQETKDVNLKPEDEKKAFELSFQIQGLKTEIPTNENEISKLDPIPRSKVESKQKQVKELQTELNDIIRQGEIKGEPVVPKKEEERIQKEKEKEQKATEKENKVETKPEYTPRVPKVKEETDSKFIVQPKLPKQPYWKDDTRKYDEIDTETFNNQGFDARTKFKTLVEKLDTLPKKEITGNLVKKPYKYWNGDSWIKGDVIEVELEDGKKIRTASSKKLEAGYRGWFRQERTLGNEEGLVVGVKIVDLNNPKGEDVSKNKDYVPGRKILKIYDKRDGKFLSWAKETKLGKSDAKDKNDEILTTKEQGDYIKTLEQLDYNEGKGRDDEITKFTKPKPKPTPTERAEEATKKIIEESKQKVKESKNIKDGKQESAVDGEKTTNRSNEEIIGKDKSTSQETKLRTSKSRIQRKVKNPFREKAAKITVDSSYDLVMQYFIGGGYIDRDSLKSFFKGKESEAFARQNLTLKLDKYNPEYAPNMKDLAHSLWEDNQDQYPKFNTEDYFNALEEVLLQNTSPIEMAKDLIAKTETPTINRQEELLAGIYEEEGINSDVVDNIIDALESKTDEELKALSDKDKWEEGTDIVINDSYEGKFYTEDEIKKIEIDVSKKLDLFIKENFKSEKEGLDFVDNKDNSKKDLYKKYYNIYNKVDLVKTHNENLLYDIVDKILSKNNFSIYAKKQILNYFRLKKNNKDVSLFGATSNVINSFDEKLNETSNLTNLISEILGYENDLSDNEINSKEFKNKSEKIAISIKKEIVEKIKDAYSRDDFEPFQKVSQRKGDIKKVIDAIKKAMPKINVVEGDLGTNAGKVSADGKTITINPNYAGLDTPIHEGGHILIDAMGYNNRIIQAAIKKLRTTPLYMETKERYKELNEEQLDKEVLAEAIGREGADIFDKVEDRSKFKAYLDYIFDWLKQKLGIDKNIAKSLAKQIIGGVKTKNLEGKVGKEQLQKESKKNPLGARPLKFEQYAAEHGFSYEKETEKVDEASYLLSEAQEEYDIAKENAENANTDEEAEPLEKILADKEVALKAAKKNFAIKGKRTFEYKKYKKDFNEIQKLMAEKEIDSYTTKELQDLISKLHSFDNKAAKAVRTEAMLKFAMIATKKQQQVFEGKTGYIAELGKTKDITPLQRRILHHSHFSENNADMQAVSLAFGNAVMDKITDANTKKATHEKLGQKVIAEENKKLGIVGAQTNRFSSDSAKYFEWMSDKDGNLMTIDEAKAKGLSEAKINYLKFTRETIADYRGQLEENNFENAVMQAIRIDKGFMEAYKSEGLLPAFSYYLGGGANNLGKVRIEHNGQIKSYSEIEKEILATADRKSITSMAKALFDLLIANIKARYQLKKGFNVDEKDNPLELKGEAEYSLNEKGQLVSKFDKPRAKDRGYSKDFYKAMNQFIDESAHTKHISKIMPLVDSVEYLNKNGYLEEGYIPKKNISRWIEDWKKLHIFKEQHVNDPVLDASIKAMRNLVASTTMWFNIPANVLNVFMGNYSNWRQENGKVVVLGNKRLFGGNGKNRSYGLDVIKKYNLVNQDYDSNATMKAGSILSKIATWGTKVGEYQIQGSLGLGLLTEDEFNSFEYTKDKYGNDVLTVKEGVDEAKIKAKMIQIKNRVTDIQGKYPDEDRRNIMKGEIGKAAFQFKVWMPDWFKERFGAKYINAYGQEKEGTFRQLMRIGIKEMYADLKKGDFKNIYKNNPSFMSNLKGLATIGTLIALSHMDDDDEEVKKGSLTFQNALSQVLFILDLEQDKYMVSNPVAALGKTKDLISAFEALYTLDEKAIDKVNRILPANKSGIYKKVYEKIRD